MTINLGRYFGVSFRLWQATKNERGCISIVIWYPRSYRELGYIYRSIGL